jgi:integrase
MAEWPEFDLSRSVWVIPAAKMKMRREHRVPLCVQAIAILIDLRPLSGHMKYVFPNLLGNNEKPLCVRMF